MVTVTAGVLSFETGVYVSAAASAPLSLDSLGIPRLYANAVPTVIVTSSSGDSAPTPDSNASPELQATEAAGGRKR